MDHETLRILGQTTGVAGVALGVFLLLYRDLLRAKIFPNLTKRQGFLAILLFLVLVWSVAIAGIVAWFWVTTHPQSAHHGVEPQPNDPRFVKHWPFDVQEAKTRQHNAARRLGVPVSRDLTLDNNVRMAFMLIPAGQFVMGSDLDAMELERRFGGVGEDFESERPRHRVFISRTFYIGATEVTREQFAVFVRATGYKTDAEKDGFAIIWDGKWSKRQGASWKASGFEQTDAHPVVNVSWNDATAFCEWLSIRVGVYCRLPSEAEWEYACRAGQDASFVWGNSPDDGAGWCNASDATASRANPTWKSFSWDDGYLYTAPAGSFLPNGWGLYDMLGNVGEWCCDIYSLNYYANANVTDPHGPVNGYRRVIRGGNWYRGPSLCRSSARNSRAPAGRSYMTGFRVAFNGRYEAQSPPGPHGEEDNLLNPTKKPQPSASNNDLYRDGEPNQGMHPGHRSRMSAMASHFAASG